MTWRYALILKKTYIRNISWQILAGRVPMSYNCSCAANPRWCKSALVDSVTIWWRCAFYCKRMIACVTLNFMRPTSCVLLRPPESCLHCVINQICLTPNFRKHARTCWICANFLNLRIFSTPVQTCTNVHERAQTCTNVHKRAQTCQTHTKRTRNGYKDTSHATDLINVHKLAR